MHNKYPVKYVAALQYMTICFLYYCIESDGLTTILKSLKLNARHVYFIPVVYTCSDDCIGNCQCWLYTHSHKPVTCTHAHRHTHTYTHTQHYRFFLLSFFGFCRVCGASPLGFFICSVALASVDSVSSCSCDLDVGKMTARIQMSWKMAPRKSP